MEATYCWRHGSFRQAYHRLDWYFFDLFRRFIACLVSVSSLDASSGFTRHVCSGTLIAHDLVLTAAHCIEDLTVESTMVVLGRDPHTSELSVSGFSHPGFKYQGFAARNDIALLFLSSCVETGVEFPRISLDESNGDAPCTEIETMSFGKSERIPSDLYVPDGRLRALSENQFIHSHSVCRTAFSEYITKTKFGRNYITETAKSLIDDSVPETIACYGGESTALKTGFTCEGDSGGPVLNKATGEIIGVSSFTSDVCGTLPNYFTRVSNYTDWIRTEILRKGPLNCNRNDSLKYLSPYFTPAPERKLEIILQKKVQDIASLLFTINESVDHECTKSFGDLNQLLVSTILTSRVVTDECGSFLSCMSNASGISPTDLTNNLLHAFPSNLEGTEGIPFKTRKLVSRILLCTSAIELFFESVQTEAEINATYMDNAPAKTECTR